MKRISLKSLSQLHFFISLIYLDVYKRLLVDENEEKQSREATTSSFVCFAFKALANYQTLKHFFSMDAISLLLSKLHVAAQISLSER